MKNILFIIVCVILYLICAFAIEPIKVAIMPILILGGIGVFIYLVVTENK